MAWVILFLAGLVEVVWASSMKQSAGFTRLWPTIITFVGIAISLAMLSWSMRVIPLGTAYTVWSGIGAVGAFLVGIVVLGEAPSATRIVAAVLILAGMILMKVGSPQ